MTTHYIELFRNLTGCIDQDFLEKLLIKYNNVSKKNIDIDSQKFYNFSTYSSFLHLLNTANSYIRDLDDLNILCMNTLKQLKDENVYYSQLVFNPQQLILHNIPLDKIITGIYNVFQNAEVKTKLILEIDRSNNVQVNKETFSQLFNLLKNKPSWANWLKAISLGGDEHIQISGYFQQYFRDMREFGLQTLAATGLSSGIEDVWNTIFLLKSDSIIHGLHIVHDNNLIRNMHATQTPIIVVPSLYVQCNDIAQQFNDTRNHPIKRLIEENCFISVSTMYPAILKTNLSKEYAYLNQIGIEEDILNALNQNAFHAAFLTRSEKADIIDMI